MKECDSNPVRVADLSTFEDKINTTDTVGTWCMVALICTCLAIVFVWNYKLKKPRFVKIIWIMISIATVLTVAIK